MASHRQIEANRRNARHSTGPRTEGGKARSSSNALVHGLSRRPDKSTGVPASLVPDGFGARMADVGRIKAELIRIRGIRYALLITFLKDANPKLAKRLRGLGRYERDAINRQKRLMRAIEGE